MPLPPLWISLGALGSDFSGALPFCGGVVASVLGYFAVKFTARAPLQTALNDAFRSLMEELQIQHASDIAHISELQNENARLNGELRASQQRERSTLALAERALDNPHP